MSKAVTPSKLVLDSDRGAGVHKKLLFLDSRFRGNDEIGQASVIPAKAGIKKNGRAEDLPRFIKKIRNNCHI